MLRSSQALLWCSRLSQHCRMLKNRYTAARAACTISSALTGGIGRGTVVRRSRHSMLLPGLPRLVRALHSTLECAEAASDELIDIDDPREFWPHHLKQLRRHPAIEAAAQLDLAYDLGLTPDQLKEHCAMAVRKCMLQSKEQHPQAIVLVRVEEGYAAAGSDAVMLLEHCGLPLPAGSLAVCCPEGELDDALQVLVQKLGFEVAIWEEVEAARLSGKAAKQYAMMQLVTPENPTYLHNMAERSWDMDFDVPTMCGVSVTASGINVYKVLKTHLAVRVYEGLSVDSAWGVINADRSTNPVVHQHIPPDMPRQMGGVLQDDKYRLLLDIKKRCGGMEGVHWKTYRSEEPLRGFVQQVLKANSLAEDTSIPIMPAFDGTTISGVRPLYLTTATQLGLTPSPRGVPALLEHVVPANIPKPVKDLLTNLLTAPPPHRVTAGVRGAVRRFMAYDSPLPDFNAGGITSPDRVLVVLKAQEANARFFQDLRGALEPLVDLLEQHCSQGQAGLVDDVWPLLLHTTGNTTDTLQPEQVLEAARTGLSTINASIAASSSGGYFRPPGASAREVYKASCPEVPLKIVDKAADVVEELARGVEEWGSRVAPHAIPQEYAALVEAERRLLSVCVSLLMSASATVGREFRQLATHRKHLPELLLVITDTDSTIRLIAPTGESAEVLDRCKLSYVAQPDLDLSREKLRRVTRAGMRKTPEYTCEALEAALTQYFDAAEDANDACDPIVKRVTVEVSPLREQLAAAVQLSTLMLALVEHCMVAQSAGWTVPLVGPEEQQRPTADSSSSSRGSNGSSAADARGVFRLRGLWPYWMEASGAGTVENDVELDGFMLLTGPNMAGKSTILRSVAAAALLGSVGLAIPAAAGSQLPLLDAVMLRTFTGDAPQDGLSAFAVEMKEMSFVLSDIRPSSLVLVDELGKGTEILSGTALAAGILKDMAASGARGIFATHLHLLAQRLQHAPSIAMYKMDVALRPPDSIQASLDEPHSADAEPASDTDHTARDDPADAAATAQAAVEAAALLGSTSPPDVGAADESSSQLYALQATWKLLPGSCFDSLAFRVAKECGLPQDVLQVAQASYDRILDDGYISNSSIAGSIGMARAYENVLELVRSARADRSGQGSSNSSSLESSSSSSSSHESSSTSQESSRSSSSHDEGSSRRRSSSRRRRSSRSSSSAVSAVTSSSSSTSTSTSSVGRRRRRSS